MSTLLGHGHCQAFALQQPSCRSRARHVRPVRHHRRTNQLRVVNEQSTAAPAQTAAEPSSRVLRHTNTINEGTQLAGPGSWGQTADQNVVLVADIGGTNCRFELWRLDLAGRQHENVFKKIYPTKDYLSVEHALDSLASEEVFKSNTPGAAAFACAGPVLDNKCVMTNLSWVIDGQSLTIKYGIRVAVLNDFEACGYGVPVLKESDVLVLNDVPARQQAPVACMGPGTGLGEANLYWSEHFGGYRVWPSEGAHASFAPRGWKQRALQTYVERQLGYCEVEHIVQPRGSFTAKESMQAKQVTTLREAVKTHFALILLRFFAVATMPKVCCGSGLQRIYEFLQTDEHCSRPELCMVHEKSAAEISKSALDSSDPLAVEAVDMFLALIGAEAGHMGLRSLASGGVYICGGIMPKLVKRIKHGGVLDSYLHEKSRFNKLLKTFPLYLVLNEGLGLLGTREYAIRLLETPEVCK